MATRKSKKVMKYSAISGLLVAFVTSGVWFASYRYYNAKLIDERIAYEEQLAEKNEELQRYQDQSKKGYVLSAAKLAGERINASDIKEELLPTFAAPDNIIRDKKELIGKYIKINATIGTTITSEMIRDEAKLDPSERIEESQYIKLPIRAMKTDVVDIRIVFPTGEDFIVVAKKELLDIDINNQYAFFHTNEEEALMLQAALVDAYINNAEIYMKQYVEPEMQTRPEPNYIPNLDVLQLIKTNPLIVDQAKWKLAEELRKSLDDRLDELDPTKSYRIGAEAPAGSGVSKRKVPTGATTVTPDNSQSVNGIMNQTNPNDNPAVLEPETAPLSNTSSSTDKVTLPDSNSSKVDSSSVPSESPLSDVDTNLLGGE